MPRFDSGAAGPSQRQLRVGELIRHAIAEIFTSGRMVDPDLDGIIITVPEVRMSPDLHQATVLVMPLGGKSQDKVIAGLERNKKWLRGQVAKRVNLKFAAELTFRLDTRYEDDDRVNAMLKEPVIAKDLGEDGDE
ncbi:MAG: 30S ribosome-binding factor RbfA, partial [Ancalomicrobiaceae bacterium]|nr:30S ribosome-binding factor RbfA [Ancalomicrobiaceae bacterium]